MPCNTKLHSNTGHYTVTLAYTGSAYRGSLKQHYTDQVCGPSVDTKEYIMKPTKARLIDSEWIATKVYGVLTENVPSAGGSLPGSARIIFHGIRK